MLLRLRLLPAERHSRTQGRGALPILPQAFGGPSTESTQTVTFSVTGNTGPGLFSVQPSISTTGTLTYTPLANAFGTATITVIAKDSGGTANGGINSSGPRTFTIAPVRLMIPLFNVVPTRAYR